MTSSARRLKDTGNATPARTGPPARTGLRVSRSGIGVVVTYTAFIAIALFAWPYGSRSLGEEPRGPVSPSDRTSASSAPPVPDAPIARHLVQDPDDPEESDEADSKPEDTAPPSRFRPIPKLEDPEIKLQFEAAVALFDEGNWKDAEKAFKKIERKAPKSERKIIKLWKAGADGGQKLGAVEKAVSKAQWKKAWAQLSKIAARYETTPLRDKIEIYEETIAKQIFYPLANFEEKPPKPQKKENDWGRGAKLNTNYDFVKRGERSLEWLPQAAGFAGYGMAYCGLADVKGEMIDEYRYLHISIYSTSKTPSKLAFFFQTGQAINMNPFQSRAYFKHFMLDKEGWYNFRIDLWKELSSYSSPERHDIQEFGLLLVPPTEAKKIYIDEIKLEKK